MTQEERDLKINEINAFNVAISRQKGEKSYFGDKTQAGTSGKKKELENWDSSQISNEERLKDFIDIESPINSASGSYKREVKSYILTICNTSYRVLQDITVIWL